MKIALKTATVLLLSLASLATLNAAPSSSLSAESVSLIQNSQSLEFADFALLVHNIAVDNPDLADEILALALSTRSDWTDEQIITLFAAAASANADAHYALSLEPDAVQEALQSGVIDEDSVLDEMAIKLLSVLIENSSIDAEQCARLSSLLVDDINNREAAAIPDLATGYLPYTTDLFAEDLYRAKEAVRSEYEVLEEFESVPSPGDVTNAQ